MLIDMGTIQTLRIIAHRQILDPEAIPHFQIPELRITIPINGTTRHTSRELSELDTLQELNQSLSDIIIRLTEILIPHLDEEHPHEIQHVPQETSDPLRRILSHQDRIPYLQRPLNQ